jgi:hypothetical protein
MKIFPYCLLITYCLTSVASLIVSPDIAAAESIQRKRILSDSNILPYLLEERSDRSVVRISCNLDDRSYSSSWRKEPFQNEYSSSRYEQWRNERNSSSWREDRQEEKIHRTLIREYLLQAPSDNSYGNLTIDIDESCRDVWIRIPDDSNFSDIPLDNQYFEFETPKNIQGDSWLIRQGSGWYWLLNHP